MKMKVNVIVLFTIYILLNITHSTLLAAPRGDDLTDSPVSISVISNEELDKLSPTRNLSLLLSTAIPQGDFGDFASPGLRIGVSSRINIVSRVSVGHDMAWTFYGTKNDYSNNDDFSIRGFSLIERVEVLLGSEREIDGRGTGPGLWGGVGINNFTQTSQFGDVKYKYSDTDYSLHGGAFWRVPVGDNTITARAGFEYILGENDQNDTQVNLDLLYDLHLGKPWIDDYNSPRDAWDGSKLTFGLTTICGYPCDDFDLIAGPSLGGGLKTTYFFNNDFAGSIGGSYQMFGVDGRQDDDFKRDISLISLDLLAEYNFNPFPTNLDTYFIGGVSPMWETRKQTDQGNEVFNETRSTIAFTLGGGFRYPISSRLGLDFQALMPIAFTNDESEPFHIRTSVSLTWNPSIAYLSR